MITGLKTSVQLLREIKYGLITFRRNRKITAQMPLLPLPISEIQQIYQCAFE